MNEKLIEAVTPYLQHKEPCQACYCCICGQVAEADHGHKEGMIPGFKPGFEAFPCTCGLEDVLKLLHRPQPSEENPCEKCGVSRTEAEGGKIFTVCDKCWESHSPATGGAPQKDGAK